MSGDCESRARLRDVICGSGGSGNPEVQRRGETLATRIREPSRVITCPLDFKRTVSRLSIKAEPYVITAHKNEKFGVYVYVKCWSPAFLGCILSGWNLYFIVLSNVQSPESKPGNNVRLFPGFVFSKVQNDKNIFNNIGLYFLYFLG